MIVVAACYHNANQGKPDETVNLRTAEDWVCVAQYRGNRYDNYDSKFNHDDDNERPTQMFCGSKGCKDLINGAADSTSFVLSLEIL